MQIWHWKQVEKSSIQLRYANLALETGGEIINSTEVCKLGTGNSWRNQMQTWHWKQVERSSIKLRYANSALDAGEEIMGMNEVCKLCTGNRQRNHGNNWFKHDFIQRKIFTIQKACSHQQVKTL